MVSAVNGNPDYTQGAGPGQTPVHRNAQERAMVSPAAEFTPERLAGLFPPERTDTFFEALFGGAEEGAYDIRVAFVRGAKRRLDFVFELRQRGDACLACNLTHGLPQVFARHPVIDAAGLAARLAALAGWPEGSWRWELEPTEEVSDALHVVPLVLTRAD